MLEPDPVAGTGVDAAGLRVGITNGETAPGAIGIPAEPVGVGEFRGRTRPGPDFDGGGLGGFQRRGHRVQSVALLGDEAAGDPQECGFAGAGGAFDDEQGPIAGQRGDGGRLPGIQICPGPLGGCGHGGDSEVMAGLRAADGEPTQIVL